jgi:hypothetical protein
MSGMRFDATVEVMDPALVRVKIARGDLPARDWDTTRLVVGGLGPCAVCDRPTTPSDPVVACDYAGARVFLHPDCYVEWDEARRLDM